MDEMSIPESRTDGDCFPTAAHIGLGYPLAGKNLDVDLGEFDEVKIVHGLPVGRGTLNGGRRFWHAWVEVTLRTPVPDAPEFEPFREVYGDEFVSVMVLDYSQSLEISFPQQVYYNIGQLDERHVWRYTPEEARELMLEQDSYGPWVDGWETMEEVG